MAKLLYFQGSDAIVGRTNLTRFPLFRAMMAIIRSRQILQTCNKKINSVAATFWLNTQTVSLFNSNTLGNHSAVLT